MDSPDPASSKSKSSSGSEVEAEVGSASGSDTKDTDKPARRRIPAARSRSPHSHQPIEDAPTSASAIDFPVHHTHPTPSSSHPRPTALRTEQKAHHYRATRRHCHSCSWSVRSVLCSRRLWWWWERKRKRRKGHGFGCVMAGAEAGAEYGAVVDVEVVIGIGRRA